MLFSRILYEQDEVDYVTRPLMKIQDEQNIRGAAYTDVYKASLLCQSSSKYGAAQLLTLSVDTAS